MAVERSEKVFSMVKSEVKKGHKVASSELHEKAIGIDTEVGKLTTRQFHARYVLPAINTTRTRSKGSDKKVARKPPRKPASKRPPKTKTEAAKTSKAPASSQAVNEVPLKTRAELRSLLLTWGRELVEAENRGDFMGSVGRVDQLVDTLIEKVGPS